MIGYIVRSVLAAASFCCLMLASTTQAASFDCAKASTKVEHINVGDGVDHVYDTRAENNVIRFGAGVDKNSIKLHLGSLLLDLGNGDAIHIDNTDQANANGFDRNDVFSSSSISSLEFADGKQWDGNAANAVHEQAERRAA